MIRLRFAAPLALLALGAAPPPPDLTAAACTLGQAATEGAFRALPLVSTEDDTEADETGTILTFDPAAASLWGGPVRGIQLLVYANRTTGEETRRYETRFPGDPAAIRAHFLAAHARAGCDRQIGTSCELSLAPDGAWARAARIGERDGALLLVCDFSKRG